MALSVREVGLSDGWEAVLTMFLSLALDNPNTRRAYAANIREALHQIGVRSLADLTGQQLAGWRQEVVAAPQWSMGTKRQRIASLRSFLRWTQPLGLHPFGAEACAHFLRLPSGHVEVPYLAIDDAQAAAMVRAARTERDRLIVGLMVGCGLRVSEVSALDVRDVIWDRTPYLLIRHGKGNKSRKVPIPEGLTGPLARWTQHRRPEGALFQTRRGPRRRLTAAGIRERVEDLRAAARIHQRVTPHALRHTFATRFLLSGGEVTQAAKILGHRDIRTTLRYVDHIGLATLRDAMPTPPGFDL